MLLRWRVAVADWPFATGPTGSAFESKVVESVKPVLGRLFTTTIPKASLASTNTVRFFAPRSESELMVAAKLPSDFVWKTGDPYRYLLGASEGVT